MYEVFRHIAVLDFYSRSYGENCENLINKDRISCMWRESIIFQGQFHNCMSEKVKI